MGRKVLVLYLPVLHQGYWQWFQKHAGSVSALYLFGEEIISNFRPLVKDLRALAPKVAATAIRSFGLFEQVIVANYRMLEALNNEDGMEVLMPDEEENRQIAKQHLGRCVVAYEPVFLRWDAKKATQQMPVRSAHWITSGQFAKKMLALAITEGQQSPDWWRQVGALAVRDGEILITGYNRHVPTPHVVSALGDPRALFTKGVHLELSPALHAEAAIVAEAARRKDLCLEGADLYVTDFPCPPCAKQVAFSGIRRLFYQKGYAVLDGEEVLASRGVKIFQVE